MNEFDATQIIENIEPNSRIRINYTSHNRQVEYLVQHITDKTIYFLQMYEKVNYNDWTEILPDEDDENPNCNIIDDSTEIIDDPNILNVDLDHHTLCLLFPDEVVVNMPNCRYHYNKLITKRQLLKYLMSM